MKAITQTMRQTNNTDVNQKKRENITHKLRSSGICLIMATAIALPGITHATVIDQIKSKVYAIKSDTASLKNKTTSIQGKISAVSSSVNAQIAEMDNLKATLDSLKQMKDKFSGEGLDPVQLLELVDISELQAKIDDLKQKHQEYKERLNDPDIEAFRAELLGVLVTINKLIAEDSAVADVTPFQTLVKNAPRPIIALLKQPFESVLPDLKDRIAKASDSMSQLEQLGLWELIKSVEPDSAEVCNAVIQVGAKTAWLYLWKHEGYIKTVKHNLERVADTVKKGEKISEELMPKLGVHGYLNFGMPKTMVAENMTDAKGLIGELGWHLEKTSHIKDLVEWVDGTSDACDLVLSTL